jgi:hypothetical protein
MPEAVKEEGVPLGSHIPAYDEIVKEVLDWLDKYQGPVR